MQSHDHVPIPQQSGAKPNRRLCIWARASFVIALVIVGSGAGAWMHAQAQTVVQNSQLEKADSFASSDDTLGNDGWNRYPAHLQRPATAPLSAMAQLGKRIFYDPTLSASGQMSCASCHSPQHAYGAKRAGHSVRGTCSKSSRRADAAVAHVSVPPTELQHRPRSG